MKTLGERFRWRREQLELTQEDAVKEINRLLKGERKLTRVTISNIENGGQDSMKDKVLLAVIKVLRCSAEWLVNGQGPIEFDSSSLNGNYFSDDKLRLVPEIEWDAVLNYEQNLSNVKTERHIPCPVECSSNTFAIKVSDESMLPRFEIGDLIFVDAKINKAMNGRYVIAIIQSHASAVFKQYQIVDNNEYLKATNPDYPQEMRFIRFDGACHIVGTVICHVKPV
ncbi:transcriptional repressor DicA [Serratia fonticola]|uniref:S24 family peptidase n=1 Tax=Serratia fonticola TaxID=47917 RepID=UPI00217A0DC7|nr:S24 family peptidase [Serratia fonticola]CAI0697670.1 transcriptional repressor DicA [Serratia fonticola]